MSSSGPNPSAPPVDDDAAAPASNGEHSQNRRPVHSTTAETSQGIPLTVRTLDNAFQVHMSPSEDVANLKRRLRSHELHDQCDGKLMRLIFMGKMLENGKSLESYGVKQNSIIHVALNDDPNSTSSNRRRVPENHNSESSQAEGNRSRTQNQQNHNDEGGGEEGNRGYIDDPVLRSRGFGRLRQIGLDDYQIQALRTAHREDVQQLDTESPRVEGESESERIARLEEQWMHRQGPYSEFALNMRMVLFNSDNSSGSNANASNGNGEQEERSSGGAPPLNFLRRRSRNTDDENSGGNACMEFFCGLMLGFFFGFFTLIWATCTGTAPRMRAGILCGIGLNILTQIARINYEESHGNPSTSHRPTTGNSPETPASQFPDWPHLSEDGFGFTYKAHSNLRGG